MKLFIWRKLLKKGWYEVTWNHGDFPIKDRLFWNGKIFKISSNRSNVAVHQNLSIFVKRMKK